VLVAVTVVAGLQLGSYDMPELDPRPVLLPLYLVRSFVRMLIAYAVAVALALVVGHLAARSPMARKLILPTLDVLQSVPILGFFPAAVTVFIGVFGPTALGVEAAAVFLIFTSMFWNLAFGVYESLITIPEDFTRAAAQLNLRGPLRWTRLLLPAVMPGLLYNSILSWANGWYFLIASEIIAAGPARYTLPGLGSYLAQSIREGRQSQTVVALGALLVVTVGMHLLVWSPLATWAERFHIDEVGDRPRTPRLGRLLVRSRLVRWVSRRVVAPAAQQALALGGRILALPGRGAAIAAAVVAGVGLALGLRALWRVVFAGPVSAEIRHIPLDLGLSAMRVVVGVFVAAAIAVPIAYLFSQRPLGRSAFLSALQVLGSFPAIVFFPLIAGAMVRLGLDMDTGAILMVLTGTFFYVMFNALSGAAAIPKELDEAAAALGVRGPRYLRRVFVPAILPRLITGCITAWGGGWNAIIFSEYVLEGGRLYSVRGIGATLNRATYVTPNQQVIAISLASMVALVVLINRVFWNPLYERVAERYKMEA
jgi:NitT/TauT family transport system permease protein